MSKRRKAREIALQSLYACEFLPDKWEKSLEENIIRRRPSEEVQKYAKEIVGVVINNIEKIDFLISGRLDKRGLEKVSLVDKMILRIAVAELLYFPDTPSRVIIDEAIEIANRFSSEGARGFVNGVIDSLAKEVRTD